MQTLTINTLNMSFVNILTESLRLIIFGQETYGFLPPHLIQVIINDYLLHKLMFKKLAEL